MKKLLLIFLLAFTASCMHAGGISKPTSYSFSVDIPQGWRRIDNNRYLLLTKDGPFLQYVLVQNRPIHRSFKHTKKKLKQGMLPQEAAEIIVDEITSDQNILNFKVLENTPAKIQGHDGFRILFLYKNEDGSLLKTLYYGFIKEDTFFNLRFTAVVRYYFNKDIETFNRILDSFKIIALEAT